MIQDRGVSYNLTQIEKMLEERDPLGQVYPNFELLCKHYSKIKIFLF